MTTLELGSDAMSMLPDDTDERHAFDVVIDEFSDGIITADIVVLAPNVSDGAVQGAIEDLTTPTRIRRLLRNGEVNNQRKRQSRGHQSLDCGRYLQRRVNRRHQAAAR